jgi:hypothetical protein
VRAFAQGPPDRDPTVEVGQGRYRDEWGVTRVKPPGSHYYDLEHCPLAGDIIAAMTPLLIHPDGSRVFCYRSGIPFEEAGLPGTAYQVDLATKSVSVILDESDFGFPYIQDMDLTPDGRYLYISGTSWLAKVDLLTGEKKKLLDGRDLYCQSLAVTPVRLSR